MSRPLVSDELSAVAPLLPLALIKPKGGRPRVPERAALGGIIFVFVLATGILSGNGYARRWAAARG